MIQEMHEELAIMKNVSFGTRDTNYAALWFDVEMISEGSLQRLSVEDAVTLIEKNGITNINNLNGKPCIIETDGKICRFKRLKK